MVFAKTLPDIALFLWADIVLVLYREELCATSLSRVGDVGFNILVELEEDFACRLTEAPVSGALYFICISFSAENGNENIFEVIEQAKC